MLWLARGEIDNTHGICGPLETVSDATRDDWGCRHLISPRLEDDSANTTKMFSLLPILCFTPLLAAYAQSTTPTPPHAESTNVTVPSLDPRLTMPWSYFYFDSMSDTDQSTLQVTWLSGFPFGPFVPFLDLTQPDYFQVTGIFPNGTAFLRVIAATTAPGSVVSTTMPFNGKNGIWPGIGGWNASGSDGAATWVTDFSTPSIKGHITLQQSGPSRYSCGV